MNNLPYVEIRPQDIQRLCYNDAQRLFYQVIINHNYNTVFISILSIMINLSNIH